MIPLPTDWDRELWKMGYDKGYRDALDVRGTTKGEVRKTARRAYEPKKKSPRKPSARDKAYSKAFKQVQHKYKKKGGGWKKDGFKRAAAAARRMIK